MNPTRWRLDTLLALGTAHVHELARTAAGSLTTFRLMLGRCLLALHESKGYKKFGCSSAIHYATQILRVNHRTARECRRVARDLKGLPELTLAAEFGKVEWSSLREIVRKATPETEAYWLELAGRFNCGQISDLVSRTPKGGLPGDVFPEEERVTTELRCPFSPRAFQILEHVRRVISVERDEAVNNADVLEIVLGSYLANCPADQERLEKIRAEADKDLQAQKTLAEPLVQKARMIAEEIEAVEEEPEETTEELLAQAIGVQEPIETGCGCDSKERPTRVVSRKIPNGLKLPDQPWTNRKLRFNHRARSLTRPQRKELCRRDGWCCRTPGCPNKIWLHIHHIVEYSKGGKTEPEGLLGLCSACHRNVHAGILKIVLQGGELVFLDSQGRRIDRRLDLELAGWLDFWHGWRGEEEDSHRAQAMNGDWRVFSEA